jgi:hypothetical protein
MRWCCACWGAGERGPRQAPVLRVLGCRRGICLCRFGCGVLSLLLWRGCYENARGRSTPPSQVRGGCIPIRQSPTGCVGSSILASLSEAGGDVLLPLASKPLPPRSLSSAKRHLECTLDPHLANYAPVSTEPPVHTKSLKIHKLPALTVSEELPPFPKGTAKPRFHPASGITPTHPYAHTLCPYAI